MSAPNAAPAPTVVSVVRQALDHTAITFNTKITGGFLGSAVAMAGETVNGEAQDDDYTIGVDWVPNVSLGAAWTYTAALGSLTFEGGATPVNSAGTVT